MPFGRIDVTVTNTTIRPYWSSIQHNGYSFSSIVLEMPFAPNFIKNL